MDKMYRPERDGLKVPLKPGKKPRPIKPGKPGQIGILPIRPRPVGPGKPRQMVPQVIDPATGKTRVPGNSLKPTVQPDYTSVRPSKGGIGNKEVNKIYRNQGF